MNSIKNLTRLTVAIIASMLLTACDGLLLNIPPVFSTNLAKYAADNGSDVYFTIKVFNNPASVTCFNGNVVMSNTGTDEWSGTADYTLDLSNHASGQNSGINTVTCGAANAYGTSSSTVGTIELIPNVAPNLLVIQPINICGNNGTRQFNDVLVDPASTYIAGAHYTLTQGSLPAGLSIDYNTGKLVGTAAAQNYNVNGLKMTATTAVGSSDSTTFNISISTAACP